MIIIILDLKTAALKLNSNTKKEGIMRRLVLAILLSSLTSLSQASTIKLNYSVFFSYMKTMYKLDYPYVTTAFYLIDRESKALCKIANAEMVVENVREPILFESAGRLLPFYSDKHRKDGGMLEVDIDDNKTLSSCDLQITVMAKESELFNLNEQKLAAINEQLEGVIKKNAGMIGKHFLPTFAGLRLQFLDPIAASMNTSLSSDVESRDVKFAANGDLLLSKDDFSKIKEINELKLSVVRITPWMLND